MDAALVLQGNACNDDYILQDVSLSLSLSYTLLASPFFITFQRLFFRCDAKRRLFRV